ncbi:MAG TPA: HAMP domain-containing sensor histidine kinase [Polyangiaceae bacterium]|jgi:signal transduction histidine kinase
MSSAPKTRRAAPASRAWRTLGLRLATWYVLVTLASYLALAAILPLTVHAWAENEGQRSTEGALDRYRGALENGGTDALRAMFDCHADARPSVAVRLSDEHNVELFSASSDEASGRIAAAVAGERGVGNPPRKAPNGWHLAAATVSEGRQLEIVLHDDLAPRLWSQARTASLLLLGCGLASAIVGAFVITRRALRPIADLARATQDIIDSGDLALRVRTRGTPDSLDQLGALFNQMLARNEALVRAMKESLDNVAHDLRTPLARLRAGAELALKENADAAQARESLAVTIEESDRVLGMLTTLMDITEAETGAMRLHKATEDLATIAREAVDLYELVSSERGVHIVTRLAPGVLVSVDRARIRQVAANLIDNAIKYTAPGGRVEVTVASDATAGVLTVADTGMGIAPEERPRVWDRLYRGDRSRSEHGLGLGLSLVKAVVEAHGGEVRLQSEVGVGSTFEARLPRAEQAPAT